MSADTSNITRRQFLQGASILGGLALIGYGVKEGIYSPPTQEQIKVLITKTDFYKHNQDAPPLKLRLPVKYVEFRGKVFVLYPIEARNGDSPLSLIYRANSLYNPDKNIKGDLGDRASDLFNILSKNELEGLVINQIKNFSFKVPPTPLIHAGKRYQVPTVTAYSSLDDVLSTYKHQQ